MTRELDEDGPPRRYSTAPPLAAGSVGRLAAQVLELAADGAKITYNPNNPHLNFR